MCSTHRRTRGVVVVAGLGVLAALSACTAPSDAPAESPAPVTLTMAHMDENFDFMPAADWFVQRVAELSRGAMTIEPAFSCCGGGDDVERQLVKQVADGTAQLGWVGTRTLADLGAPGMAALHAPLLLDSYALQEAVLAGDVGGRLTKGIAATGVDGIWLVPGAKRFAFSSVPLAEPADWQGIHVHVLASDVESQGLAVLGAVPVRGGVEGRDAGLGDFSLQAVEGQLVWQVDHTSQMPDATVNEPLWARTSAIVAGPGVLAGLSAVQRDVLVRAAKDVVARTGELAKADQEAVDRGCAEGGHYPTADDEQVAALKTAFGPEYLALEKDPDTAAAIRAIQNLATTVTAEPAPTVPEKCAQAITASGAHTTTPSDDPDGTFPQGTWTVAPKVADLVAGGFTQEEAQQQAEPPYVLTFDHGHVAFGPPDSCSGTYTVKDGVVSIYPGAECVHMTERGQLLVGGHWRTDGSTLTLLGAFGGGATTVDQHANALIFGSSPWTR